VADAELSAVEDDAL